MERVRFAVIALVVLAIACGSRAEAGRTASPAASSSPSTAPTGSPTATATPSDSPSPSARPNPTAGPGTYVSLALAYRVDLPNGWRRSACQSSSVPGDDAVETFTAASVDEESGTDIGPAQDVVVLRTESNPTGASALAWLEAGKMGHSTATHFEKATIDGKDGARIVPNDGSPSTAFVISARGRMYAVQAGIRSPSAQPAAIALMNSVHVLSDTELANARASLATPAPAAARTAQQVADTLARGFAQKDVDVLASVATGCITRGLESAGASFSSAGRYFRELKQAFANGTVVTVQASPLVDQQPDVAHVRGTWMDAGRPQQNVRFFLRKTADTWYWDGVIFAQP